MASVLPPPTGEPMGAPVRARTELSRSEYAWTFRALMHATDKRPPWWTTPMLAVALVLGLTVVGDGWLRWVLLVSATVGLAVSLFLVAMPFLMHLAVPADRRVQEVELSIDGISSGTDQARVSYSWDAVSHVVRGRSMLLLVTHERGEGIAIPYRVLTDEQRSAVDVLLATHAAHAVAMSFR